MSFIFGGWFKLFCTLYGGNSSEYMQDVQRRVYTQNSAGFPEVWSPSTRGWLNRIKERALPVFSALNWIFLSTFCWRIDEVFWIGPLSSVRSQLGDQTLCGFLARCLTAGPWAPPQELLCKVDVRKYLTNSARPTAGERRAAGEESEWGAQSDLVWLTVLRFAARKRRGNSWRSLQAHPTLAFIHDFLFPHRLRARLMCASRSTLLQPLPHTGFLRKEKVTLLKPGIIKTDIETESNVFWLLRRFSARGVFISWSICPLCGIITDFNFPTLPTLATRPLCATARLFDHNVFNLGEAL